MLGSAIARLCALLLIASPVLSGCKDDSTEAVAVVAIGAPTDPFERGIRLSTAGRLVRGATAEGLVALDESGQVIPAMADRWIVTDDGLSYIFRLRDGVWPDGPEISGESVRMALQQALKGLAGTTLALDLGSVSDIRAMAGRVVEVRLERPMPDLLQLLAQPELGLYHKGSGNGPMAVHEQGRVAVLSPMPPAMRGLAEPPGWQDAARSVRLQGAAAANAVSAFTAGNLDLVLGGRFQDYPLAKAAGGLTQRHVRIDPAPGLFGLVIVRENGLLDAPEIRESLAMAIDRDALAVALGGGWRPTTRIAPANLAVPAVSMGERWANLDLPARQAAAARRVADWQAEAARPHGTLRPRLSVALPGGPGADLLFARLAEDFAAVGLELLRVPEGAGADLRLLDAVARYNRPEWFLGQLSCAARRGLCNKEADDLLAQALAAPNPLLRAPLLDKAEAALSAANVFIPLGSPVRWALVRDGLTGFSVNAQAYHPLATLAVRTK
ncbi:MAG: ABC transporter substrate-binding protein [Pseudomonadota bacterium]